MGTSDLRRGVVELECLQNPYDRRAHKGLHQTQSSTGSPVRQGIKYAVMCKDCKRRAVERALKGLQPDVHRPECVECKKAKANLGHRAGVEMSFDEQLRLKTFKSSTSKEERAMIWQSVMAEHGKRMMSNEPKFSASPEKRKRMAQVYLQFNEDREVATKLHASTPDKTGRFSLK